MPGIASDSRVALESDAVKTRPHVSLIIPIYNEQANIAPLMQRLFDVVGGLGFSFEVLAIDDGSQDGTFKLLEVETLKRPELKVIRFRRNYGQTAAMMAGIDHAAGETYSIARNRKTGMMIGSWRGSTWAGVGAAWDFGSSESAGHATHG